VAGVDAPQTIIEVFADIACPFTHVGLRRFVERRDALGRDDVVLRVRAWPLERVNAAPLDPAFIAEEIVAIRAQVAPDLFTGFVESSFPTTSLPAFAVAAAAYRRDDRTGEAVSLALRDLLFERGVDVTDAGVLDSFADEHGLTVTPADRASAGADYAEGTKRDVTGSPHFFTPGGPFFCPVLDVRRDAHDRLLVQPDPDGLARFLTACTLQ
jgi:predicted DsbA family dithiol-disulfide isomerase